MSNKTVKHNKGENEYTIDLVYITEEQKNKLKNKKRYGTKRN